MLYTVRPLEQIYAPPSVFKQRNNMSVKADAKGTEEIQYREVLLPNGRIMTRRDGDDYVIERINSTDMQDYLNAEYVPGKSYKDMNRNDK